MQNIDLICVGKLNAKYFAEGVAEYQKRLSAFASFRIIELPEEKIEEKNASDAVVKKALDKAVSYTHLDVYKRQAQKGSESVGCMGAPVAAEPRFFMRPMPSCSTRSSS